MIPHQRDARTELRDDAGAVEVAARRCRILGARLADAWSVLARDGDRLAAGWQGPAAAAARTELVAIGRLLDRLPPSLGVASVALQSYAAAVEAAECALAGLETAYVDTCARHERMAVSTEAVAATLPGPVRTQVMADLVAEQQAQLRALTARRTAVLDDLGDHARLTGHRLRAAADSVVVGAGGSGSVTAREPVLAATLPMLASQRARSVTFGVPGQVPDTGTPAVLVSAWWAWLTGDERDRLVRGRPAALGRLPGLPALTLDAANRRVLARDLAGGVDADRRADGGGDGGGDGRGDGRGEAARRRAAGVVAAALGRAQAAGDPVTGRPIAVRLLGFSPRAFGGEGRVLVAVGDPDTADNVAYLVPGMGNDLVHSAASLVGDAERLTTTARRLEPAETTATVGWLGYDTPGFLTVASGSAAAVGGVRLAGDLLAAASRPVTPHLTVIGHSYGSTTVGAALRRAPSGVDDVVLLGSPGAGVGTAAGLHVPAGHVFVGASSRDPVSYLDRFGVDPAHERFGAVRFEAEDPTRNPSRLALGDHLKYLRARSESLVNVARVVVGDDAEVTRAPYRRELRLRPDGISADPEADRTPTRVEP